MMGSWGMVYIYPYTMLGIMIHVYLVRVWMTVCDSLNHYYTVVDPGATERRRKEPE